MTYTENFLEIPDVDDANKVDLSVYAFVRFSETRNCYIFKRRRGK